MLVLLVNTIGAGILDNGDEKFRVPLHYCADSGELEVQLLPYFVASETAILLTFTNVHANTREKIFVTTIFITRQSTQKQCLKNGRTLPSINISHG